MLLSFASLPFRRILRARAGLALGFALSFAALLAATPAARAQFGGPAATQVHDAAALKPPPGARVAIIEFDDMECPACAEAHPILMKAVATYHIPWIRHDFLIPAHTWSPAAAVFARWFDLQSKKLGDEYRNDVFANQPSIYNPGILRQFTQQFAKAHGIAMPFLVDPQGKIFSQVQADVDLGRSVGITHTPTIFIAMARPGGDSFIEVLNPETDLFQDIDKAMAETRP